MPRATVDRQSIFYRLSANDLTRRKPPLLLMHGAGGTHMHWPASLRRLPDWDVYALDLPGHGKSPGAGHSTIAGYRDAVYGFCQALALERVVLAGHSMGGAIAQDFALHYPGRLAGLILVGAGARLKVAPAILDGLRADFAATAQMITGFVHGAGAAEQMKRLYLQRLLENDPEVVAGDFVACDQFDVRAELGRIQAPALVICGTADIMTPPRQSEFLAANLPRARLVLAPNVGHMIPLEASEELTAAVQQFLLLVQDAG